MNIPLGDLHIRFDDSPHGQLNPATSIAMPMYAAGFAKASAADDLANLLRALGQRAYALSVGWPGKMTARKSLHALVCPPSGRA